MMGWGGEEVLERLGWKGAGVGGWLRHRGGGEAREKEDRGKGGGVVGE